jgi:threonine/homoserine/homoserine lactone efflux protein
VDWYNFAQFLVAALVLLMTPGPVMAIVAHNTLRHGATAGLFTVMGVELGELCLLGATFAGLTLSAQLLPVFFRWLSLAGALYLVWLAADALRFRDLPERNPSLPRARKPIIDGLTIALANPGALLFYIAFFPQFIDPYRLVAEQMAVLGAVYVCATLAFDCACVLAVAHIKLPAAWARFSSFAGPASAAVYLSIAIVTILKFIEGSG